MDELRKLAAELLSSGQVKVVIGYEEAPRGGRVRPALVTDPGQANRLLFDQRCVKNLAVYLQKKRNQIKALGRPAIVVKGCDARAVAGLLRESQIAREDVVLIGVHCPGVWEDSGGERKEIAARCVGCDCQVPELFDHLVGANASESPRGDPLGQRVAQIEALSPSERWAFWLDEFSWCTRCNACREACPLCYCERCVQDKSVPQWVEKSPHDRGNFSWNLTRAMHLAGRCVGCGECERACPARIPLGILMRKMKGIVESSFGDTPNADPSRPGALVFNAPGDDDSMFK